MLIALVRPMVMGLFRDVDLYQTKITFAIGEQQLAIPDTTILGILAAMILYIIITVEQYAARFSPMQSMNVGLERVFHRLVNL